MVKGRFALCALFFLHAAAMAAYAVPFPNVLDAHGLGTYLALAGGTGSLAAFISPMIVGTLADRRFAPERLLAMLTFLSGTLLTLVHCAVEFGWGKNVFLALMMGYALSNAPGFSLVTSVAMSRLSDARKQFGPIRVWGTIGWMVASLAVGFLFSPLSTSSGYVGGAIFFVECAFCLLLRPTVPVRDRTRRRLRDYMGWDAMALLRHKDHRLIFLTATLLSAVLSTFYLYTVRHLKTAGDTSPAATMGWAQIFEGVAAFGLASVLLRFRIKWVLTAALVMAVARFVLLTIDNRVTIFISVCLHGPLFVLFFLTCQIYLEQRVDARMRSQGQALLALLNSGVGNLTGYIVMGWWYARCQGDGGVVDWPRFWTLPALACVALTLLFVTGYRGRRGLEPRTE